MPDIHAFLSALRPGDLALITGTDGVDLLAHTCEVLAFHQGLGPATYCGRTFTSTTIEPQAFILCDGYVWLWSLRYLMPLSGEAAELSWRKREVSYD